MSYQALLKVFVALIASLAFLGAVAQAQDMDSKQACPHEIGWTPSGEEIKKIFLDHQQWLERWRTADHQDEWATHNPQGRANLCNANLNAAKLDDADLRGANLSAAGLKSTRLIRANLRGAKLNNADLRGADLVFATLENADISGANLLFASLHGADLSGANLSGTNLSATTLIGANLSRADLKDAQLAYANLTNAHYAPASAPPNAYVAGIQGLETVTFPQGHELGLVQLRKLLQDAGLRDQERQATYAIETGRTTHALNSVRYYPTDAPPRKEGSFMAYINPCKYSDYINEWCREFNDWRRPRIRVGEGAFRFLFFDLTTSYGLRPGRSLAILVVVWAAFIPLYWWAIWRHSRWSTGLTGIYRIWPKDRIVIGDEGPKLESAATVERLQSVSWAALCWSAWFSLLSAFHIGFREFSVGTWLSRVHPRQFTLEATGWVRALSGVQSLLSVYLLAMWVLTYFGRPFQ
jgi:hypothetical protein